MTTDELNEALKQAKNELAGAEKQLQIAKAEYDNARSKAYDLSYKMKMRMHLAKIGYEYGTKVWHKGVMKAVVDFVEYNNFNHTPEYFVLATVKEDGSFGRTCKIKNIHYDCQKVEQ